jgi:hypothetical protein
MAITDNDVRFLCYCKTLGASFEKTLTLGRLNLYASEHYIKKQLDYFGVALNNSVPDTGGYAESLFRRLGADVTDSIDYSDYEHATIIHDLNKPLAPSLKGRYTAVIDGGTIEHVFNFPVAISNCMQSMRTGGHYIGITPVNNLMGHGFYQFSPELYYRVFSESNGFEVIKMIIAASGRNGDFSDWYEVTDPAKVGSRATIINCRPTYLFVLARKNEEKEIFATTPQQSDYGIKWNSSTDDVSESFLKRTYQRFMPLKIRDALYPIIQRIRNPRRRSGTLGSVDSRHFRKIHRLK